jgi:hypothetical protein
MNINNGDWLRYRTWDLYRVGTLITTLPDLLWALDVNDADADEQKSALEDFTTQPAYAPAPEKLKSAVSAFLGSFQKDAFTPPQGVQASAKRALEWIKDGKAGDGFTNVGRKRASDLANGHSVSLETLKRMKAYFDRHQPDKKAEGFRQGEKGYPSAGRVAWDAWGGDAGYSWAKSMVARSITKEKKPEWQKLLDKEQKAREAGDNTEADEIHYEVMREYFDTQELAKGDVRGHDFHGNQYEQVAGENTNQPSYVSFIQRQMGQFYGAGGKVESVESNKAAKSVANEIGKLEQEIGTSGNERLQLGVEEMKASVQQFIDSNHGDTETAREQFLLVARDANGNLAACINGVKNQYNVAIGNLGSAQIVKGAATSLQERVAQLADGTPVLSYALLDAVEYHELIGRQVDLPYDEENEQGMKDGSVQIASHWDAKTVNEIASLPSPEPTVVKSASGHWLDEVNPFWQTPSGKAVLTKIQVQKSKLSFTEPLVLLAKGDVVGHDFHGNQYSHVLSNSPKKNPKEWSKEVSKALIAGKPVSIDGKDLKTYLQYASLQGEKYATADITNLGINGTRLMGKDGLGYARTEMPQISSKVRPQFLNDIKEKFGITSKNEQVDPTTLQPAQKEISAVVAGQKFGKYGGALPDDKPILVSNDNYVVDGNHRWVQAVAGALIDPNLTLPVIRLSCDIQQAIKVGNDWAQANGISAKPLGKAVVEKGDVQGHSFHGNQWITTGGGFRAKPPARQRQQAPAPAPAPEPPRRNVIQVKPKKFEVASNINLPKQDYKQFVALTGQKVARVGGKVDLGGNQQRAMYKVTMDDGSKGIVKEIKDWRGISGEQLANNEILASKVGMACDFPIRQALPVEGKPDAILQPWVDGERWKDLSPVRPTSRIEARTEVAQKPLSEMAFFDQLTANSDRHGGNAMVAGIKEGDFKNVDEALEQTGARVVGIDHSLCFVENNGFPPPASALQRVAQEFKIPDERIAQIGSGLNDLRIGVYGELSSDEEYNVMEMTLAMKRAFPNINWDGKN